MKYVVFIPDGMVDYPIDDLDGMTPLMHAQTPNMDAIARRGITGCAKNIPDGMEPGSDVAMLSILGYDPQKYYCGRGALEAAGLGLKIAEGMKIFRCNLVTAKDGVMLDHSAGNISTDTASALIQTLRAALPDGVELYTGVGYRHILAVKEELMAEDGPELVCTPAHNIIGKPIEENLPHGKGSEFLKKLILGSQKILAESAGDHAASMIWIFWGGAKPETMPSFQEKYGLEGTIITAVGLLKGLARLIGLEAPDVPGATSFYDTN